MTSRDGSRASSTSYYIGAGRLRGVGLQAIEVLSTMALGVPFAAREGVLARGLLLRRGDAGGRRAAARGATGEAA